MAMTTKQLEYVDQIIGFLRVNGFLDYRLDPETRQTSIHGLTKYFYHEWMEEVKLVHKRLEGKARGRTYFRAALISLIAKNMGRPFTAGEVNSIVNAIAVLNPRIGHVLNGDGRSKINLNRLRETR